MKQLKVHCSENIWSQYGATTVEVNENSPSPPGTAETTESPPLENPNENISESSQPEGTGDVLTEGVNQVSEGTKDISQVSSTETQEVSNAESISRVSNTGDIRTDYNNPEDIKPVSKDTGNTPEGNASTKQEDKESNGVHRNGVDDKDEISRDISEVKDSVVLKEAEEEVKDSVVPKEAEEEVKDSVVPKEAEEEVKDSVVPKEAEEEVKDSVVRRKQRRKSKTL